MIKFCVDRTVVNGFMVSTVFLSLLDEEPFETMIFQDGSWTDLYCERCSTLKEAEAQHAKAVELIKSGNFQSKRERQDMSQWDKRDMDDWLEK